jgi:hypothetical protein
MTGRERILTALSVEQPDRVPLYIHGINEAPIIGILFILNFIMF